MNGTEYYQYLDKNMDPSPWATSLILQVSIFFRGDDAMLID